MDIEMLEENTSEEEKVGYRDIFRQKEYMKIIVANIVSRFGDSIDSIAFTWLVYAVTGSAAWTAVIFALNQLPSVILQPFAGAMVEGMNKKRIMVVTDVIRGAIVALLAGMYVKGIINPLVLAGFTLVISSVEAFCLPAGIALIPKIIDKKYFAFGTSMNSTFSSISQLIGLGLAGVIIGMWGIGAAMLVDGVTFFLSAFITSMVKVKEEHRVKVKMDAQGYFQELKEGFSYIKVRKIVFNFCILAVIVNAITVPLNSLQTPMAVEIFGLGSELLSIFGVALIAGMSIGTFILPYFMEKFSVRGIVVSAGIISGVAYGGFALGRFTYGQKIPSYLLCGVISVVLGMAVSWILGAVNIQFMKSVEEEYLARAASIFNACASAAAPIMSLIVSGLSLWLSVGTIFMIAAVSAIVVFMVTGIAKMQME